MSFVHLHCHSEYSLLDGANRVDDLIARALELEQPALAITDHGNMHAAWEFQEKAKKAGIKPILGMEAYVAPGDRRSRQRIEGRKSRAYYHLVLLAQNPTGYKNLVKLSSLGFTEGFYSKPRVDRELLARYSEGLVVSSACMAGEVASHLLEDNWDAARETASWYAELFKGRYFLEVQAHDSEGQARLNERVFKLAEELGLPVIATNDAHFLKADDHAAHDVLLCIGLGKEVNEPNRMHYDGGLYFKSADEMRSRFTARADVLENTLQIADESAMQFKKKYHVPSFPLPEGVATENDLLVSLTEAGVRARYGDQFSEEVRQRMEYELDVITKTGYAGYFLIVYDFIKAARDLGIPVGPGRGSAAGSLVAYALGITNVCPLKFDLLFERFLNPERVSMPDIDVDFCFERRGEVIEYVRQKYGRDSVGQIITFGTLKSRAAVKDVGRALGFTPGETDALAKLIPNQPNYSLTVGEAVDKIPEVKKLYAEERYRELMDYAISLEGLSRHAGVHAAGVVIAPGPIDDYVPVCTQSSRGAGAQSGDEGTVITQYDMNALEKAGMLKMDFLGLTTLTVITDAVAAIRARGREVPNLDDIPLDDDATYQMLRLGKTAGVFQFESPLATDMVRAMRCDSFNDLVASNALMRPGPLDAGMHRVYIRRKRGDEPVSYLLPEMEEFLNETYGVITYQEQVMRIAQKLAGISLAEADVLRKAVGKKDADLIRKELGKFSEKAIGLGHDAKIIHEIAGQIETFGRYGFNKCLVGDTEIFDPTSGRLVRIEDLYNRTTTLHDVLTCDTASFKLKQGRVIDVMDNGIRPVYRLRTESGREIEATGNHPFLAFDGWRELSDIAVGTHIAVPRNLTVEQPEEWAEHEVIALGHLLAESNLCHPTGVYYYNQDAREVADFVAAAERFSNVACSIKQHKGTDSVYTRRIERKLPCGIFEWAGRLGMLGKTAVQKEVPQEAFRLANSQIGLLLSRMWAGDGHLNAVDRNLYYATSSKRLAGQVQHLLLRLGILGRVRRVEVGYRGGSRTGYQVFVTGNDNLRRFSEHVGSQFLSEHRRQLVADLILESPDGGPSRDLIPVGVRGIVRAAKQRKAVTWASIETGADVSSRDFYPTGTNAQKIGFTRSTVNRLATYFEDDELQRLSGSDVLWDRVVAVDFAGEKRTYDLEIADTHNFVANDIIVHNSHSVAYSIISYQTAWLKTHFPAEFMAALLSSQIGDTDSVVKYINEAREIGLELLPPDVNESGYKFTVIADARIRFGLGAVRNVGKNAIDSILVARAQGPFKSLFDMCNRVDLRSCNKRVLEALIHAGALDTLGGHRAQFAGALDTAIREASLAQEDVATGQVSIFGDILGGGTTKPANATTLPNIAPWSESERLANEKAIIGFYTSGHPLEPFRTECELFATHDVSDLGAWTPEPMALCCVVTAIKRQTSKKSGAEFARLTIEDFSGSAEVLVFPEAWSVISDSVRADIPALIKGGYSRRDEGSDNPTFIVESVSKLAEKRTNGQVAVAIDLTLGGGIDPAVMRDIQDVIHSHPGTAPLELRWSDGNGTRARWRSRSLKLSADGAALKELRGLLGDESVSVVLGT